ncbi:hypothetical protein PG2009B_0777 [Bifidobacterium pseudolongum subsp. globosum]|nr:hypothetical protein PG2009B_0777 [Bifidobacterium pseudolongum subsp. globosum]
MKSKTRKLLATVAVLGSLFGFTGIAQAYEVYGLFPFECVRAVLHHLLCE